MPVKLNDRQSFGVPTLTQVDPLLFGSHIAILYIQNQYYVVYMASLKDRTGEFKSAVESVRLRSSNLAESKRPLLANGAVKGQRSQFASMAAKIGKDIQGTTFKMEKLAQC